MPTCCRSAYVAIVTTCDERVSLAIYHYIIEKVFTKLLYIPGIYALDRDVFGFWESYFRGIRRNRHSNCRTKLPLPSQEWYLAHSNCSKNIGIAMTIHVSNSRTA